MLLKKLIEKRNALLEERDTLISGAEAETRALNADEIKRFEAIRTEITGIDKSITVIEEAREYKEEEKRDVSKEYDANAELRAIFKGDEVELRAMNTTTNAEGGFVVNKELSKTIIKALKDRSNVYTFFNGTNVPGSVKIPKKVSGCTAQWMDENPSTDPTASTPNIGLIELGQNRLYSESAITQQMVNVQELNLQQFIIEEIGDALSDSIENAIFNGTGTKQPTGIIAGLTKKVDLATRGVISFNDLKKAKAKLKKSQLATAKWFMNSDTMLALDLLQDTTGRPLLQPSLTDATGYTILGIPVETTDCMPTLVDTGAKCVIVLATPDAYHTNTQKGVAFHVYNDSAYTKKGLIGYATDVYLDGKTKNDDSAVGIFNKAS